MTSTKNIQSIMLHVLMTVIVFFSMIALAVAQTTPTTPERTKEQQQAQERAREQQQTQERTREHQRTQERTREHQQAQERTRQQQRTEARTRRLEQRQARAREHQQMRERRQQQRAERRDPTQQQQGWRWFNNTTARELRLDADRLKEVRELDQMYRREYHALGDTPWTHTNYRSLTDRREADIKRILTPEQYARWSRSSMQGSSPTSTPDRRDRRR